MYVERVIPPDEFWERTAAMDATVRELFAARPCFGIPDWAGARTIGEWSFGDSTFRSVQYDSADASGQLVVSVSDDTTEDALAHVLMNVPSDEPFEQRFARPQPFEVPPVTGRATISVAGRPTAFDLRVEREYTVANTGRRTADRPPGSRYRH